MQESLETFSEETNAVDNTGASSHPEHLPVRMLDLTGLTLADLRESRDPRLEKAVASIISAAAIGKFGDDIQGQRD